MLVIISRSSPAALSALARHFFNYPITMAQKQKMPLLNLLFLLVSVYTALSPSLFSCLHSSLSLRYVLFRAAHLSLLCAHLARLSFYALRRVFTVTASPLPLKVP